MNASDQHRFEAPFAVALFGPCNFTLGRGDFAFLRRRSALPLLVFLALNRKAPIARDYAAFNLWPDETEERARELLRRNLYLLAQSLPGARLAPWILAENDSLLWSSKAPWDLDLARFEDHYAAGDPERLAAAVAVYRGDLCEGLYDEWIFAERERLRGQYLDALDRLVRVHRSRGEPSLALGYALRARAAEPWREDLVRRIMHLRYELGDRAGAIVEFETFAARLREEFGAEPMPETLAARDAVMRCAPSERAAASDAEEVRAPKACMPLVGREREMAQLRAAWARAARGNGSVVVIGGERGIGKSRLLGELALAVEAEGGRVLVGATSSPERRPYEALGEALSDSWRLFAELPIGRAEFAALATVVPELQTRCELRWLGNDEPIREQARLFEALARGLTALATLRPTLLVLDDAHYASDATMAAVACIATRAATAPLLIAIGSRTGNDGALASRRQRELGGAAGTTVLTPGRLTADDVARAIATRLPASSIDGALASEIAIACDGNPLALAGVVRELAAAPSPPCAATLATKLVELIRARFERCTADARAFGEMAAIAGHDFEFDIVARALGWDEARASRALDELLDSHFIEDASRTRAAYRFAHAPLRAGIERTIAKDVRRCRHRRLAAIFESLDAPEDDRSREIARHAERGGDLARAACAYELAARRAAAACAVEEAKALFERGFLCAQSDVEAHARLARTAVAFADAEAFELPKVLATRARE